MASKEPWGAPGDERPDEVWLRTAGGEMSIRLRSLSNYLERGGMLAEVRLVQDVEGIWSMWVRLADRPGEFRVNQFHTDAPKTYKDVALAHATIREDLGYVGPIVLSTDRRGSSTPNS